MRNGWTCHPIKISSLISCYTYDTYASSTLDSGGASSEKSERNGGGGDFDVIFQSKGIPN